MHTHGHASCTYMYVNISQHTHAYMLTCPHITFKHKNTHTHVTPTVHAALPICYTFGNNLIQATGTQAPGLYINIGNTVSCTGNATAWNVCYYCNKSDATMTSYFAIYRPTTGTKYDRIGSAITYNATRNLSTTYVCERIPIPQSQQYVVQPQDVLAVCLKSVGSGYQGMVASPVTGASVLMMSSTCPLDVMGTSLTTNQAQGFNTVTSTTLHISIGT